MRECVDDARAMPSLQNTYEGLKRGNNMAYAAPNPSLQNTYEGLKINTGIEVYRLDRQVYRIPMRD